MARQGSEYGSLIDKYIKEGTIVPVEITCKLIENVSENSFLRNLWKLCVFFYFKKRQWTLNETPPVTWLTVFRETRTICKAGRDKWVARRKFCLCSFWSAVKRWIYFILYFDDLIHESVFKKRYNLVYLILSIQWCFRNIWNVFHRHWHLIFFGTIGHY